MGLTKVGYKLIKDNFKDAVSGSWQGVVGSGSLGMVSGSAISTASFGRLESAGNANIDGNLVAGGTITAQEFHTEFVSASITFTSGSHKFGDDADDIHQLTGSTEFSGSVKIGTSLGDTHQITGSIETSGSIILDTLGGNVSGSVISTGSFGAVNVAGMTVPNLINVSSSVSTRATTLENANISGGFVAQTVLSGSGTLISGSAISTGSFGMVGIGGLPGETDSKFAVDGNIEMLSGSNRLFIPRGSDGALTTSIYSRTGNNLTLSGAGSSAGEIEFIPSSANSSAVAMTIDSNQRVGIGTASPDGPLHVFVSDVGITASADADDFIIENNVSNAGVGMTILSRNTRSGLILFGDGDNNDRGRIQYNHAANYMRFDANGSEVMRISGSGNVGIGTTAPGNTLELAGASNAAGEIKIGTYSTGGHSGALIFQTSRNATIGSDDTIVTDDQYLGYIEAKGADGNSFPTAARISFEVDGSPADQDMPGRIGFHTTTDGGVSLAERMRIDSSGNVIQKNGILSIEAGSGAAYATNIQTYLGSGDTTLTTYIDSLGGASWTGEIRLRTSTGGGSLGDRLVIENNGNITVPNGNIYLDTTGKGLFCNTSDGSDNEQLYVGGGGDGGSDRGAIIRLSGNDGGNAGLMYFEAGNVTGGNIKMYVGGAEKFRVEKSSGDIYSNDGSVSSLSDLRVKKDVSKISYGLDEINLLNPVNYKFNGVAWTEEDEVERIGFIYQELVKVLPIATNKTLEEETEYGTIAQTKLIPILVKAVQELSEQNKVLEKRIEELEN